jgi:hypothetical protein
MNLSSYITSIKDQAREKRLKEEECRVKEEESKRKVNPIKRRQSIPDDDEGEAKLDDATLKRIRQR